MAADSEQRTAPAASAIGPRAMFTVVYATSAAAVYFALGLVASEALGLTPVVFLAGGLFLGLAAMSYAQGALGQSDTGGSSQITGRAFNELIAFAVGWAAILDFIVVLAICAVTCANYLGTLWEPLASRPGEIVLSSAVIVLVAATTLVDSRGIQLGRRSFVVLLDVCFQAGLVVLGLIIVGDPSVIVNGVDLGSSPSWSQIAYASTLVVLAATGIEAVASLSPEIKVSRRQVGRLLGSGVLLIVLLQVGLAVVGLSALPVTDGTTALGGEWLKAPIVGLARSVEPGGAGRILGDLTSIIGALALMVAAASAMLGVSRLSFSMTRHRQIPRVVGRISGRWGTPWLIITLVAVAAIGLAVPGDVSFLASIYAFGALLAITAVHVSIVKLSAGRDPAEPVWRMPMTVALAGRWIPVPALFGAVVSAGAWATVVWLRPEARWIGIGWLSTGLLLYVAYRRLTGNALLERVEVPGRALRYEREIAEFGSILVPILGSELDDDIVQTAGRLAGGDDPTVEGEGAHIEAIWFHEIPISLTIDAPLSGKQTDLASSCLRRAKDVGEEYEGVTVSTAQVRVRRLGEGIVNEAIRRGAEVIVLAAEGGGGISGGQSFGGTGGRAQSLSEMTRYVLRKAPCRVILTVPAATAKDAPPPAG